MDFSFHRDSTRNIGRYFSDFPIFTFVFLHSATIVYFGDATAKLVSSFWLIGMKNGIESYNRVHLICWKHFVSLPWRLRIVLLWRQRYQWATVVTSPVSSLISMRWRQTRTKEKLHWSPLLKRWRHWWRQQHHLTTASTSTFETMTSRVGWEMEEPTHLSPTLFQVFKIFLLMKKYMTKCRMRDNW